jgi:hypothetical protein
MVLYNTYCAVFFCFDFFRLLAKYVDADWNILEETEIGGGLEKGRVAYWYSYDRDNLVLKYGKGYIMEETTALIHDFLKGVKPEDKDKVNGK